MHDRDCGEDRVHNKRTGGLAGAYQTTQDIPLPLTRLQKAGGWLGKSGGNRRFGLGGGKRAVEYPGICTNSQKGPQREPSEAGRSGPESTASSQTSAFLALLGSRMISIEQQVRVD
jgi:hypothetical protein